MVTEELDIDNLILTLQGKTKKWVGMPAGTTIGHIHLKGAELEKTAEFYTQLGFEVTQEYGDQAIFFASGEYHHHIGANTWQSAGASALDADTAGLNYFEIIIPNQTQLDELLESLSAAGNPANKIENEFELIDPNGIRLHLVPNN